MHSSTNGKCFERRAINAKSSYIASCIWFFIVRKHIRGLTENGNLFGESNTVFLAWILSTKHFYSIHSRPHIKYIWICFVNRLKWKKRESKPRQRIPSTHNSRVDSHKCSTRVILASMINCLWSPTTHIASQVLFYCRCRSRCSLQPFQQQTFHPKTKKYFLKDLKMSPARMCSS